jgi:hypothetical protein
VESGYATCSGTFKDVFSVYAVVYRFSDSVLSAMWRHKGRFERILVLFSTLCYFDQFYFPFPEVTKINIRAEIKKEDS